MSSIASSPVSQVRLANLPLVNPSSSNPLSPKLSASAKDAGGFCPANIKLDNGKVLSHVGDVKLLQGNAYLFVDASPGADKSRWRQTYLYAGDRVFALGSYTGENISDMNLYARGRTVYGNFNPFNGAGGLHNEILKQAEGANYAMAVKKNSSGPQISVPLQTDSMFPGDKDAVVSTATNLGLAPEPNKSSIQIPNNEFGGGAFVMMYEAKMENAQKRGLNPIRSKVSDLVPNASPAFYKGAQDAYRQVQIGNFLRLGEAALGVLGASKAGMLGYRNATRLSGSSKLSYAPGSIPGGFGVRPPGNNRGQSNRSIQQNRPTTPTTPTRTNTPASNPGSNSTALPRSNPRNETNGGAPAKVSGSGKPGSQSGVNKQQVGNGTSSPGSTAVKKSTGSSAVNPGQAANSFQTAPPSQNAQINDLKSSLQKQGIELVSQPELRTKMTQEQLQTLEKGNKTLGAKGANAKVWSNLVTNGVAIGITPEVSLQKAGNQIMVVVKKGDKTFASAVNKNASGGLKLYPLVPDAKSTAKGTKSTASSTANSKAPQTNPTQDLQSQGVAVVNQKLLKTLMTQKQLQDLQDVNSTFGPKGINAQNWSNLVNKGQSLEITPGLTLQKNGNQIMVVVKKGEKSFASSVSKNPDRNGLKLYPLVPEKNSSSGAAQQKKNPAENTAPKSANGSADSKKKAAENTIKDEATRLIKIANEAMLENKPAVVFSQTIRLRALQTKATNGGFKDLATTIGVHIKDLDGRRIKLQHINTAAVNAVKFADGTGGAKSRLDLPIAAPDTTAVNALNYAQWASEMQEVVLKLTRYDDSLLQAIRARAPSQSEWLAAKRQLELGGVKVPTNQQLDQVLPYKPTLYAYLGDNSTKDIKVFGSAAQVTPRQAALIESAFPVAENQRSLGTSNDPTVIRETVMQAHQNPRESFKKLYPELTDAQRDQILRQAGSAYPRTNAGPVKVSKPPGFDLETDASGRKIGAFKRNADGSMLIQMETFSKLAKPGNLDRKVDGITIPRVAHRGELRPPSVIVDEGGLWGRSVKQGSLGTHIFNAGQELGSNDQGTAWVSLSGNPYVSARFALPRAEGRIGYLYEVRTNYGIAKDLVAPGGNKPGYAGAVENEFNVFGVPLNEIRGYRTVTFDKATDSIKISPLLDMRTGQPVGKQRSQ